MVITEASTTKPLTMASITEVVIVLEMLGTDWTTTTSGMQFCSLKIYRTGVIVYCYLLLLFMLLCIYDDDDDDDKVY